MLVLVAATGDDPEDFDWCVPGELVIALDGCDASTLGGLGEHCNCGCVTSWLGLASRRATTAAAVADLDTTREQVIAAVSGALDLDDDPEAAAGIADEMLEVAARYDVGTTLRRKMDRVRAR